MNEKNLKILKEFVKNIPPKSCDFYEVKKPKFDCKTYEEFKSLCGVYTFKGYPYTVEINEYPILKYGEDTKKVGEEIVLKVFYHDDPDEYPYYYGGEISLAVKKYK